jgi:photosystem II stability/assembly factor-like uncharacterized protein
MCETSKKAPSESGPRFLKGQETTERGRRMRRIMSAALRGTLIALILATPIQAQWTTQHSGTQARLRGLSVVSAQVAWASGTGGTVVRTTDRGGTWQTRNVPGASELDFRDIQALDDQTAWILSIGPGALSRVYQTSDGGETWSLRHTNPDPKGFLDAIALWPPGHGLALGDPVDGRFTILTSDDSGKSWKPIPVEGMPPALAGEGAFAASGTCLIIQGEHNAWFGTGGAGVSRVFRSTDRGRTWTVHETPIRAGSRSSGIFSLAFRDESHGVAIGGDFEHPDQAASHVALTSDGGRTWTLPKGPAPGGYRSAVCYVPGAKTPTLIAVGPTGSDYSLDDGATWSPLGNTGFHAVGFAEHAGFAVGDNGLIARFEGRLPRTQ